ncbi:uncharacterized protein LOC129744037 [Uranotaenia lowii]|uniref:uncharacterized protein LOC129744037 n=1 Tax=Uranotaenia lowii TaxID=190385 RepID=UPI00247A17FF|nr:uncharacterized protein LOC129744037 [Uranotaenia lowii]
MKRTRHPKFSTSASRTPYYASIASTPLQPWLQPGGRYEDRGASEFLPAENEVVNVENGTKREKQNDSKSFATAGHATIKIKPILLLQHPTANGASLRWVGTASNIWRKSTLLPTSVRAINVPRNDTDTQPDCTHIGHFQKQTILNAFQLLLRPPQFCQ